MTELTEAQKKLIALALHGLCARQGPTVFEMVLQTAKALGITEIIEQYATSWINYSKNKKNQAQ